MTSSSNHFGLLLNFASVLGTLATRLGCHLEVLCILVCRPFRKALADSCVKGRLSGQYLQMVHAEDAAQPVRHDVYSKRRSSGMPITLKERKDDLEHSSQA